MSKKAPTVETVNALLSPLGLKVTHSHEEIFFVEHNLFIVLASQEEDVMLLCFNRECAPDKAALAVLTLFGQADELDLNLGLCGSYVMEHLPGEEIKMHFHPQQTVKEDLDEQGPTH